MSAYQTTLPQYKFEVIDFGMPYRLVKALVRLPFACMTVRLRYAQVAWRFNVAAAIVGTNVNGRAIIMKST